MAEILMNSGGSTGQDDGIYTFGPFRLDAKTCILTKEGNSGMIALPLTAARILLVMIENHGTPVSRTEFMKKVWNDKFVAENNLDQQIARLKKALSQTPGDNAYIENIPGRGYRFVAPVNFARRRSAKAPAQEYPNQSAPVGICVDEDSGVIYEIASGDPSTEPGETPLEDFMEAAGRIDMANREERANTIEVPEYVETEIERAAAGRAAMAETTKMSRPLKLKSRTGANRKGPKPHHRPKKGSR